MISGKIDKKPTTITGSLGGTGGGGTSDHKRLVNRDAADQHPISAISGLQEILDSKLDSETAMPLIEDAVQHRAAGLWFDLDSELADKPYWYLTSEIDPVTGRGTKESVISGPYNLGAGGGGGGGSGSGGVTEVTLIPAIDQETGESMWPTYVAVGSSCVVGVVWSSSRDEIVTGRGTLYAYVNGKLIETKAAAQGLVTFDISSAIISGENKVEIRVVDAYSTTKNYIAVISGIALHLASNFEDDISYTGDVTFTYVPTGNIRKEVYFILDGRQYGAPEIVESSGEQWSKLLPQSLLRHGSHTLEVYFTCMLDGVEVKSNSLFYDLICYETGNNTPIIASTFQDSVTREQYVSFVVKYRVFTPNKNNSEVYLITDGVASAPLTIDQKYHSWECRFDVPGNHTLGIRTGSVAKLFNVKVIESTIHIEPVTQAVALELSSYGRSNAEPLEQRSHWNYNDIIGDLSGFNWTSNGWVLDDDGITTLRLSGDARAVINYKPFATDFTSTGKTFEFEIATSDVKNYEARIFECLDGADTITFSQAYSGEDTRTKRFVVESIDSDKFIAKVLQVKGTYAFIYNGAAWNLDGIIITPEELESEYGITTAEIDLDSSVIEPSHYMDGDRIMVYYTVAGHGFYITPQLAKLQSQQASLSTQYKEGNKVKLAFVVEKRSDGTSTFKTKLIYMYINGILSGVSRYPEGDSFQQTPAVNITIGSNDATVDVYTIRIYNNNLNRKQIVNNWIADTRDPVLKAQRYKHNDNYNDENKISLDKIALLGNLPYMVLKGENLPAYKKDRKIIDVEYVNPADPDRDFTATKARADVQGTSSQYYYRKNFKIKFEGGFTDSNGNWSEHYKIRGDDSKKEKTFTFKADVASSEGTNNVELVRYFEDTKNWFSPPELEPDDDIPGSTDSKKRIRVGIDGFPIVMFHDDGNSVNFYGKMNFNNDKDNKRTYGFDEGDECWEFLHNTSDLVLFKNDDLTNWQDSFESRYPEEYGDDEHAYGTAPGELDKLQRMVSWVSSTRRNPEDSEEEKARKLNKFKSEFTQYFDKTSSLFYYLYTELFLMVDSRAKNAMVCYYKSRTPGDGGNKWFWIPYDMDTALGINNEGLLVFNYDKEDTDLQEGAFIYNGQDSTFWQNVRDAFPDELRKMYEDMRTANGSDVVGWSYEKAEKYFDDHQAVWSETIFNEDEYTKYLEPYVNNQDATYLGMAQGSKAEQRKWWLSNRFKYLDSKYLTGDAKDTNIMLRAYAKSSFEIKPYLNCYLTGIFDQATAGNTVHVKADMGKTTVIEPPAHWDPAGVDSVVILYSADLIQDIGDISGFKPGYADFSAATKLQRLIIGNPSPSYENGNLRGLNIGANHLLTYLDARNCKNLGTGEGSEVTPTIDLAQCYSIEEVYFDNTQIKGANFPVGGNLKKVHLPETITNLTLRNHPNLNELVLAGTSSLTSIWLEDIPSNTIKAGDIISQMPAGSTVRLININETMESVEEVDNFYAKLATMQGKDGKGDTVPIAQITGVIHVPQSVNFPYADWARLTAMFPEVTIDAKVICTVSFWNEGVFHDAKSCIMGQTIALPEVPLKASTQQYYYTFNSWDQDFTVVDHDMDANASFDAHIQIYTVTFDIRSQTIEVTPTSAQIEWGTYVAEPIINEATIPGGVNFLGWYTPNNTKFNFETDKITNHITLSARWQDENTPTVSLTRVTYNKFAYHATDNMGVSGWTVSSSDVAPELDDYSWINISPTTVFDGEFTINHAGDYYFYVKDDQGNISSEKITASSISLVQNIHNDRDTSTNIISLQFIEGEQTIETNFALNGTVFEIGATVDQHYGQLSMSSSGIPYSIGDEITIIENTVIQAHVQPREYTVTFNVGSLGTSPATQTIVYKHLVVEPTPQTDSGYILSAWMYAGSAWSFNDDEVLGDIILVADWQRYDSPTSITINVPEDNFEVKVNLTQANGNAVRLTWGDGSTESPLDMAGAVVFTHTYAEAGAYIINIYRQDYDYQLGKGFDDPAIVPIEIVTNVNFAFDVAYTKTGAFRGATGLTTINLTRFMTSIGDSAFEGCTNVTSFADGSYAMPDSIQSIGNRAFQGCEGLTQIILPNRIRTISDRAFADCTSLVSVTFADTSTLMSFPSYCFFNCVSLENINIPSSVNTLKDNVFRGCTSLATIDLGANVTNLGDNVFANCSALEDIKIRAKAMESTGSMCFQGCSQIITAGPLGGDYNLKFGWTTAIPDRIFSTASTNASYLRSIVLPNTIKTIGVNAFMNCAKLNSILFPYGLERIGEMAFYYCFSLTSIDLPSSVVSVGPKAFQFCRGLRTVYLRFPSSIDTVDTTEDAWFAQTSFSTIDIHIPVSVAISDANIVYGPYWCWHSDAGGGNYNWLPFTNDLY